MGNALRILGEVLERFGSEAEAEEAFGRSFGIHVSLEPTLTPDGARSAMMLGRLLAQTGRRAEGLELLGRAVEAFERALPPTSPRVIEARQARDEARGESERGRWSQ